MTTAFTPVEAQSRITAIDAVRGFALLGIFMVNIQSFGEPFGEFLIPKPPDGLPITEVASYYFVKVFCESKFYPLFAMLFGFGLMMQAHRAGQRGRSYFAPGFRRYAFLALLGLLHALLFWYGDILFLYGIAGLFLLMLHRASTKALAITGGVFLTIAALLMTGFSLLSAPPPEQPPATTTAQTKPAEAAPNAPATESPTQATPPGDTNTKTEPQPAEPKSEPTTAEDDGKFPDTPVFRLFTHFKGGGGQGGPADPTWLALEREAFTSGSTIDRLLFNAFNWTMFLVVCLVGFGWDVLAMLLLGAVLFRLNLFHESRRPWHVRFVWLGVLVGLPMALVGAFAGRFLPTAPAAAVFSATSILFGPLLSLGYLSAITIAVSSGVMKPFTTALSCVGRLALSNYLLQTLAASFVFYEWGLGLFDQTTRIQRLGIVLAIYIAQVVLSILWLKLFRYGPMEYLWRTVTYLRPPGRAETAA